MLACSCSPAHRRAPKLYGIVQGSKGGIRLCMPAPGSRAAGLPSELPAA